MTAIDESTSTSGPRPADAHQSLGRPASTPFDTAHRAARLLVGLCIYGLSHALLLRSILGNVPWDVLHQGVALHSPLSVGMALTASSLVVMLLWIPLRMRPGLGTLANVALLGLFVDLWFEILPEAHGMPARLGFAAAGVVISALATVLYISAGWGPGPRDGLMTGLTARTGLSTRLVRTCIELSVVGVGFLLGGTAGIATLMYAFGVGPLIQQFARIGYFRDARIKH